MVSTTTGVKRTAGRGVPGGFLQDGGARGGVLKTDGKELATPAPLLPTYRGQLPYLPAPVWDTAEPGGYALAVSAADLAELNIKTGLSGGALAQKHSGRSLAALAELPPDVITVLVLRGAAGDPPTWRASSGGVLVQTRAARVELTAERLGRLHKELVTDLVEAPWAICKRPVDARKRAHEVTSSLTAGTAASVALFAPGTGLTPEDVAELARTHRACGGLGISFDGGGVGSDGMVGDEAKAAIAAAANEEAHVLVTGSTGEPGLALELIGAGAALIEARFPFTLAERGEAVDFHSGTTLLLRDGCYARDGRPLVRNCPCDVCSKYSRAYLHHLLDVHEMLAPTLLAKHNAVCYTRWFVHVRAAIAGGAGSFEKLAREFFDRRARLVATGTPRGVLPL